MDKLMMFFCCTMVALMGFSLMLGAQDLNERRIDSLKSLLSWRSRPDQCDVLYELTYEYFDIDNKLALDFSSKAYIVAKQIGDSLRIVKSGRIKATAFQKLARVDSSIAISLEILPIALRNDYSRELKSIYNILGIAYMHRAEYDKALNYQFQSLTIREKFDDDYSVSVALSNIGMVFYKIKDYRMAFSYYERALKLRSSTQNNLETLLINMSLCCTHFDNFRDAQRYLNDAVNLCAGKCSKSYEVSSGYAVGVLSFKQGQLTKATSEFLKSYELAKELGDKRFQLDNIIYLSQVYIRQDQLDLAEKYLENAEVLIDSGIPYNLELIKIYHELFSLYKKSQNFEKVAYYQEKYILLKDSVYNEELTTNLMKVEAEYLERENKAKIEAQTEILVLNNEVISRQRILNIFVGIVSVLLFAIAVILIRSNRQKARSNIQLEMKVKERTLELEVNAELLQRSLYESKQQLQRMFFHVKSSLATINGLCTLGLRDGNKVTTDQYIEKIKTTSDHLLAELSPSLVAHSVAE